MCNAAYAGVGVQAFGALSGAMGAGQQASAAKAQAKAQAQAMQFQAKAAMNNAKVSKWQAEDALNTGQQEEALLRLRNAGVISDQKVGYAASGVALDSESAIQTMASTKYITEYDATTIRNNAARQAWGYEVESTNYVNQAISAQYGADVSSAQASAISPSKAIGNSLLGSAVSMAPGVYAHYKAGSFDLGGKKYTNAGGGSTITAFDVSSRF